ncbi:hypothetical protein PYW07_017264 [Mythimna separata]|uniref:Major facilitator superfamily (MFS) profile domain-containing protein n=1 Tax=Mythimna separata TaxID=271217 RepID=A0AAD7YV50_MYTSE|nr:hypothetical protein PYW07_017264 [Mythimna separata]
MVPNNKMQYLAASAVSIATMTTSTAAFWSAPILPKFHNNETSISLTSSEISWVVAIMAPGMATGSLVPSFISDKFGRRFTLLTSAIPFIIGTMFVLWATEARALYIGRFLWGIGFGMITTVSSVYLSEIADKEIRGTLTAITRFMANFGALLVLSIGSYVSYQVLSYFMIVLPICYFLACLRIPESPYYLLKEGKVDSAREALLRLSGNKNEKMVEEKLSLMRSDVRREMLRSSSAKELFTGKQYRRAVIISAGLRFTQMLAGTLPIEQYIGRIVQQSNCGLQVSTALLIFGAVRFVIVSIATMTTSTAAFWSAPILPKFHNNETSISLTSSEISWVVAIMAPGMVAGSLVPSFISDRFGRRFTLLTSAVPFIIGTVFVLWATEAWAMYIGRFLWGIGFGMITTMVEERLSLMRSDVRREMLRSSSAKELFTGKQYRKAVIISAGLRFTQMFAGTLPIQQYIGRIIQQSNCGLQVSTALLIFGAVRFVIGLISPIIVDKMGRRPLLIYSYMGSFVMLTIVGAYFFLQKVIGIDDESSNPFRFVVFIGIICSIIISGIGYDTLIFIIPSEIFPMNVRSVASTTLNVFTALLSFVAVKGYQGMEDWTGLYGVFWFYASMALSGAIFTHFVVLETKGKSLREIQIELQGNIYDDTDEQLKKDATNDDVKENSELKQLT